MRVFILAACAMALTASTATTALADSPWDGSWKLDTAHEQMPKKPQKILLKGNVFQCMTCEAKGETPADGAPHPVTGSPYYDARAVKAVDDHTVRIDQFKAGKSVGGETMTVSADGDTITSNITDATAQNGVVTTMKGTMSRVGPRVAGAHLISGDWRAASFSGSDAAMTYTMKLDGDMLTMTDPTGDAYTAKLDGSAAPFKGNNGIDHVRVRRIDAHTIEETDLRGDKVITVLRMTLSPDGKTMMNHIDDRIENDSYAMPATKQ